jgi:hypothetical protein
MLYSKPANTPLATNIHLSTLEGKLLEDDPYDYRQMVGALLYQMVGNPRKNRRSGNSINKYQLDHKVRDTTSST